MIDLTSRGFITAVGIAAIYFASRIWARAKFSAIAKRKFTTPLFDVVALEIATTPTREGESDPAVLEDIRQTFKHLNRQSFAEEFWSLDKQLTAYYEKLPVGCRATMRASMIKMLDSGDRWLQVVAAKTCADLTFREAAPALRTLIERPAAPADPSTAAGAPTGAPGPSSAADGRFREELAAALARLDPANGPPEGGDD